MDDLDLFPEPETTRGPEPSLRAEFGRLPLVDEEAEAWRNETASDPLTDLRAEQSLLGAVMLDNVLLADACALVTRLDFSDPRNATILDALVAIDGQPSTVTPTGATNIQAVCNELRRVGHLNSVGGAQYVAALARRLPTAAHMRSYAEIVADLGARRRLRDAGEALVKRVTDARTPVDVLTDRTLREVEHAGKGGLKVESQVSVGASLLRTSERTCAGQGVTHGVTIPWPSIDRALRGLRGGRVHYLAAKTSMGKSSLARNLATALAAPSIYYPEGDARRLLPVTPVLFYSLEMPTDENAVQVMASLLGCSGADVEAGNVDMRAYCPMLRTLEDAPLVFDDTTDSAARMVAHARQFVRKHKRAGAKQAVVMVDYLQLCDPSGFVLEKNPTRERLVAAMSREWKRFAMKEDAPIVVLSQLNRDADDEGCPKLKHLRESGSVEQDADVVMFLWGKQPEERAPTQEVNATIAKNRGGPRPVNVPLTFHRSATRFFEFGAEVERPSNVYPIRGGRDEEHDPGFTYDPEGTNDEF